MGSKRLTIKTIEELYRFLNKDGVLEIALRDKDARFKKIQKVVLDSTSTLQNKTAVVQKVGSVAANSSNPAGLIMGAANLGASGVNIHLTEKCIKMLSTLTAMSAVNIALSGLNLCATCVGFAIMSQKLNGISGQITNLVNAFKRDNSIQAEFEFNKALSEHTAMLDARKRHNEYSFEQMRSLVDLEYNVLDMLLKTFQYGITEDRQELVTAVFSLACMLSASIKYFDEEYYFENRDTVVEGDKWYAGHGTWMTAFDRLTSAEFMEMIRDFGIFELDLTTTENDLYFHMLYEEIFAAKDSIRDNQLLIEALDTREMFNKYNELTNDDIKKKIEDALTESGMDICSEEMKKVFAVAGF